MLKIMKGFDVIYPVVMTQVDPAEWRLEVERVAPRLKITVASTTRDWRSHLDDAHKHSSEINALWPSAQTALQAVQTEVSSLMIIFVHSCLHLRQCSTSCATC